jgi:hypothetical protein
MAAGNVSCGQTITIDTTLTSDVGPCPGDGVLIGADGITLNLNGHQIVGDFNEGASGEFAGIRLPSRSNVTVAGNRGSVAEGRVAGFEAGVVVNGGSRNNIGNLVIEDNVGRDDPFNAELGDGIVIFDSASNQIVNNVVSGNGIFDGIGILGPDSDNTRIQGNVVSGTRGPSDGGPAGQGIIVNGTTEADAATLISGTRIFDNAVSGSGSAGIANINNVRARIERNVVVDNGLTNLFGNGIGVQMGFAALSIPSQVLVKDNESHGNGRDGIQILSRENRIINNDAADNNALGLAFPRSVDLRDGNQDPRTREFDCDSNVWEGNTWGDAFYFPQIPDCVTGGGSGPIPPSPQPEGPFGDPTCRDGIDNDRDGFIDSIDIGSCASTTEGPRGSRRCSDGLDNDGDGLIDGDDPGCLIDDGPPPCDPLDPFAICNIPDPLEPGTP